MGVCYHMWRFPVGYQSGQLGRTVNPLALPSYVRIVDPPPFFARGFGHGLFVFPTLFLHENTKGRKGLGTSPFGPAGLSTVPIPCVSVGFLEKQANRRCRSVPTGRLTKPLAPHSPIGTSQTCRGCRENFSLPGRGGAPPTPPQNQKQSVSRVRCLCEKIGGGRGCELCVLRNLQFLLPP